MKLKPIQRSRLYESAVDQIRSLILADNYKPGDRLPSERSWRNNSRRKAFGAPRLCGSSGPWGSSRSGGNGTYRARMSPSFLPRILSCPYQFPPEGRRENILNSGT